MSMTIRLTAAQTLVRYLSAQQTEEGTPFIAGVWAIFGHGNVAGIGEALHASRETLPTWRGHNEQTMAHAAIAYAKQLHRTRAMAVTSSIGPGAYHMEYGYSCMGDEIAGAMGIKMAEPDRDVICVTGERDGSSATQVALCSGTGSRVDPPT